MSGNELHELLRTKPTVWEVQALIDKYPNAVREKTINGGTLPLHWAAMYGASLEVIKLLIKEYPDAVKEKGRVGWLPLHLAVKYDASKEVLQLLIKEYPDAVKVKDQDGKLPLSRPEIKEIYDRVVTVVQTLTRGQGLRGDHAKGKDQLGVEDEIHAIAETIAMKDLPTPFVVGILGSWGSGKSFIFNLIREYLKEIQKYDLETEAVKDNFSYVGHIYPILFSAWAYAKGCLWSSLMHLILTTLNDQLDLEEVIGPKLLKEGVSVLELMDEFTTKGEMEYLKTVVQDESVQQALRKWRPSDGSITKAFIDATNSNYEKEVKELEEKRQQLYCFLALEEVTAKKNAKIQPEIKMILKDAYKNYAEEYPDDPIPQTVDAAINSIKQWKGKVGRVKRYRDLLRAGRLSPLWFVVFLLSLILAVMIPYFLGRFDAIATAIGPLVTGIYAVFYKAREKLGSAHAEIVKVASEMRLDKEQVQKALEAADGAQLRSDTNDEEKQQNTKEKKQNTLRGLNAEINSLEGRVWLREGDSLKKVVADRVGSNKYEEGLGVVHQAQKDLKYISDEMMSRKHKESLPRGDPHIVLFIDDLDRCPPKQVVETLEAVQLLVDTDLFVVVLAIDANYVTLCLEDYYPNILRQERSPSGLDYIEKIIQLPYRVPPISAECMESYLQEQMNPEEENDDSPKLSTDNENEVHVTQEKPSPGSQYDDQSLKQPNADAPILPGNTAPKETPTNVNAPFESNELSVVLPTKELKFTSNDLQSLKSVKTPFLGGNMAGYGTLKIVNAAVPKDTPMIEDARLVDVAKESLVFKNAAKNIDLSGETRENVTAQSESKKRTVAIPTKKLTFTRKELQSLKDACVFSGVGPRSAKRLANVFKLMKLIWHRRDQTTEMSMKDACLMILALCASNPKSVRQEMCKVLAKIEKATSRPADSDCGNLKDFIKKALGDIGSEQVDDSPLTMIYDEKCNGVFEKVKWEDNEEWNLVKKDLRLVRSFSFVGEYNESHRRTMTQNAYPS